MSQTIQGVRTIIYKVTDMAKAKEWYSQAFETMPYFDEPYYVGFTIAGYELGLHIDETPADKKGSSVEAYRGVDDVQATFDRFVSLGAEAADRPSNVGGDIVVATVKDPFGNTIGFIYNPEFKLP